MLHTLYVIWANVPDSRFSDGYSSKVVDSCVLLDDVLESWLLHSELGLNPYIEIFTQERDE